MFFNFFSSIVHVENGDPPGGCTLFDNPFGIVLVVVMVVLLLGAVLMPLIRRKGKGGADELHANLAVGDKVMTVCGIIGEVKDVTVNSSGEKEITICTGSEACNSYLVVHISGIYKNFTKPPIQRDFFGRPKPGQVVPEDPNALNHDLDEPAVAGTEPAPTPEPFVDDSNNVSSVAQETVATKDKDAASEVVAPQEATPTQEIIVDTAVETTEFIAEADDTPVVEEPTKKAPAKKGSYGGYKKPSSKK